MTATAPSSVPVAAPGATRSPRGVLWVLVLMCVLAALQSSVVVPMVSRVPAIFGVSAAEASWIVTSTMLGAAVTAPIVSRLADMVGKRRTVVMTLVAVGIGSLLVAVTDNFGVAVAGRALQGTAMALTPVAMSIVKDVLPPAKVGSGVALLSGTMGLGTSLGLPTAGLLYWLWGWHALFWLSAVAALAMAGTAQWLLPESLPADRDPFDLVGAVLLTAALLSSLLVISQGNEWGWASALVLTLCVIALLCWPIWVLWERRVRTPLVDLRLAMKPEILLTNTATLLIAGGMLANMYLAAQQLGVPREVPGGLGLSATAVGVAMIGPAVVLVVMTPVLGPLLTRLGGRLVLMLGALVMAVAYLLRIWMDGSAAQVVTGSVLVGLGIALGLSAQPIITMAAVPPGYTASANGINSLFRTVGTAASIAGIAALTSVTSTSYAGAEYPTRTTFHLAFAGCVLLLLVALVLVALVPRKASQERALPA